MASRDDMHAAVFHCSVVQRNPAGEPFRWTNLVLVDIVLVQGEGRGFIVRHFHNGLVLPDSNRSRKQ